MINPIFASTTRRRMRSWRVPIVFTLCGLMMLLFALLTSVLPLAQATIRLGDVRLGLDGYVYLMGLQFLLIVLVAPALTAGSIAGERERQTLEMLLVTNTGSFRIALGKLMESFGFLALLIVSMLPFSSVALIYGGVGIEQIALSTLFMLVVAFAALSVGLFASALFKRTVTATVVAYLAIFAIGIGTILPLAFAMGNMYSTINANPDLLYTSDWMALARLVPVALWFNPAIGLLTLLASQTGILESTLRNLPSGYALFDIFKSMRLEMVAMINMATMAGAGLVLTLISAVLVRPRVRVRAKGRRHDEK